MTGCCEPRGYDQIFGGRFARRIASRYRKRGLDKASRRVVDAVPDGDLSGATVLEIGGAPRATPRLVLWWRPRTWDCG